MGNDAPVILAIDDNKDNLIVLCAIIGEVIPEVKILTAQNSNEGLELAKTEKPDVILLDIKMPGTDGYEVCRILKQNDDLSHIPVIFVTSLKAERDIRIKALEAGAEGFLSKPVDDVELAAQMRAMIKIKEANNLKRIEKERLESLVSERTKKLNEELSMRQKIEEELKISNTKLQKTLRGTINTLASIVEIGDPYTSGHQKRVAELSKAIALKLGLDKDMIKTVSTASIIHDIGKITIPQSILSKPGKLSEIELSLIQTHSQSGYDMIKNIEFNGPIADIILQHHERLDGSGYPNGLKGKDIIIEARIVGVADVVEAMSSHRPYRPALGIDEAIKEITKNKGKLYDTKIVDIFLELISDKSFTLKYFKKDTFQDTKRN